MSVSYKHTKNARRSTADQHEVIQITAALEGAIKISDPGEIRRETRPPRTPALSDLDRDAPQQHDDR